MNYTVIFVVDRNATNTDAQHNAALNNMVRLFADVMTTEELLGFLQSSSAARGALIDMLPKRLPCLLPVLCPAADGALMFVR